MTTPTDADLLRRYLSTRDETAFAAIVRKHGSMVFGACRRVTAHHHDAEDAFQAVFLVLAVRAEAVRPASRLGAWLHGVAVRCARKARDARRRTAPSEPLSEPTVLPPTVEPDLPPLIDDALAAIPDTYRAAVVLCHLEGRSRAEAARELGWSEGTLSGRLHRALDLLGRRLAARGVTASGAAVLVVLSARTASASVPAALSGSIQTAASLLTAGFAEPAGPAATLAAGVVRAMSFRKLKLAAAVLIGVFGVGSFAVLNQLEAKPADGHRVMRRNAPVPEKKLREWREQFVIKHGAAVTAVAASTDMIAVTDEDCVLKAYNPEGGKELGLKVFGGRFMGGGDALWFSGNEQYLMMSTSAGGVIRYERQAGALVGNCFAGPIVYAATADLGLMICRQHRATKITLHANLWEVARANAAPLAEIAEEGDAEVRLVALAPDGKRYFTANADSVLKVWDRETQKVLHAVKLGPGAVPTALKLSADGKRVAAVGEKGFARVIDTENGKEVCELKGLDGTVNAVAFTPDGTQVATASGKAVRVFDAKSGKLLGEIRGHDDEVTGLAFTADGKRLVTGSKDKTAKVWEAK